jgi:hypothetical protein
MPKTRKHSLLFLILVGLVSSVTQAQSFKERFSYRGYLKDLRAITWANVDTFGTVTAQYNFVHHRLNTRYQLDTSWELGVELRNRVFYGEFLKYQPGYGDQIGQDPGIIDMSWSWINDTGVIVAHTMVDRLWLNYSSKKWDVRLGRQRINWGQNIVWNPNDLFNVLNYADFDYEERPGSDAFKVERYFKKNRSLQLAYKFSDSFDDAVFAAMYRFNKKNYDVQVLAGKYNQDLAVGVGWAGNIKNAGFKGESTYFHPILNDTTDAVVLTSVSWDKTVGNGTYWLVSALHNSNGTSDLQRLTELSAAGGAQLDLKSLMPNKYSIFVQVAGQINPIWSLNLGVIGALDIGGAFAMPTIGYSIKQNLDLSLVGQSFLGVQDDKIKALSNALFVRFKWSY